MSCSWKTFNLLIFHDKELRYARSFGLVAAYRDQYVYYEAPPSTNASAPRGDFSKVLRRFKTDAEIASRVEQTDHVRGPKILRGEHFAGEPRGETLIRIRLSLW